MEIRNRSTHRSFCPLDCPDACSLEVHVENERVVRLEGDHRNPVTQGFICRKVRRFPEHMYGPDRLLYPQIRVGPKSAGPEHQQWRRASWDEALEHIARTLTQVRERYGGEAILPFSYGGSNGTLSEQSTDTRLFRRLGASRLARTVCAAPSSWAHRTLYGRMPGVAYEDYPEAELIVLWGANPSASGIHLVPFIRAAQKRGAKLVVLDPRRIPLAHGADLHLPLRPGTDLPVALALIRWLFAEGVADEGFLEAHASGVDSLRERAEAWSLERAAEVSGVPRQDLLRFAQLYAESSPAVVRCGWGPERNQNGGSAIAAVLALPAVAGKFGVRGGGFTMSNGGAWNLDTSEAVAEPPATTRQLNMNHLGRALLGEAEPGIHALFVYNCNPLATMPDQQRVRQGLLRDDLFTVVFDAVRTDTASLADVLLPATTFLEHSELSRSYGTQVAQLAGPVVPAAGEARSNFQVFLELGQRLGLERPGDATTEGAFVTAALEAQSGWAESLAISAGNGSQGAASMATGLAQQGTVIGSHQGRPVQFVDIFPRTPDGKICLCPDPASAVAPPPGLPEAEHPGQSLYRYREVPASSAHPLALISPATNRTISSTLGQLDRVKARLAIHPEDAAARGIGEGDPVRVYNELGEVRCAVALDPDQRPGVVLLPKGLWSLHTDNGATANSLCPDGLEEHAGGACFNDARVEVSRLEK